MGNIFGYARCSTNETKQDIERQKRELRAMGATEIYYEYQSGTKHNREELKKLLAHIQDGDTIVATEVSRITRSTKQLCDFMELAKTRKVKLIFGNFVVDCTSKIDPMTAAMLQMTGVFAELERNMTVDRINSGLAHARSKGVRLGRPALTLKDIPKKVLDYWDLYKENKITKTDYAKICDVSRTTIYKYIALLTDG